MRMNGANVFPDGRTQSRSSSPFANAFHAKMFAQLFLNRAGACPDNHAASMQRRIRLIKPQYFETAIQSNIEIQQNQLGTLAVAVCDFFQKDKRLRDARKAGYICNTG